MKNNIWKDIRESCKESHVSDEERLNKIKEKCLTLEKILISDNNAHMDIMKNLIFEIKLLQEFTFFANKTMIKLGEMANVQAGVIKDINKNLCNIFLLISKNNVFGDVKDDNKRIIEIIEKLREQELVLQSLEKIRYDDI